MLPTAINDAIVEAGISGPARPALLAIAHILTAGNKDFRWPGSHAGQGDVAGMYQVMSTYHGAIPAIATDQARQAVEIYNDLVNRGQLQPTPAEEVTADSLARIISTWRMPASHDKPKNETEHARWLPQAKTLLGAYPQLFARADDSDNTKRAKLWIPIAIAAFVGLVTLIIVSMRR